MKKLFLFGFILTIWLSLIACKTDSNVNESKDTEELHESRNTIENTTDVIMEDITVSADSTEATDE